MPADTVNIFGKAYPRNAVLLVAAAGAGIAGYAWWTSRAGEPSAEVDVLVPEEAVDTGVLPFGGTTSGTFAEGPVAYRNDQEWFADALDKLLFDYGVADTPTASDALNRYLDRSPLTKAQVPMINFVIRSIGPPPSGARPIREEASAPGSGTTPPPGAAPGPVRSLKADTARASMLVNWRAPTGGADRYRIEFYGGRSTGGTFTVEGPYVIRGTQIRTRGRLRPNTWYGVRVTALDRTGRAGPSRSVTRKTKR